MLSGAVIMSMLVPMQIQAHQLDKFNLHEGYLVNATISTARIIGLPNLAKRAQRNTENHSEDLVWLVRQSVNQQKKITRREKFIREFVR
jgi:competence protein ComGC